MWLLTPGHGSVALSAHGSTDKTDFAFAPSDGGRHRTGRFGGDKL